MIKLKKFLRKILVKSFVGFYKIGKYPVSKAFFLLLSSMLIPGIIDILCDSIEPNIYQMIPFIFCALIIFVYFRIFPVKREELSKKQLNWFDKKNIFIS